MRGAACQQAAGSEPRTRSLECTAPPHERETSWLREMENFSRPLSPSVGGAARKPMSSKLMSKLGMQAVEPPLTAAEEAARPSDFSTLSSSTSSDESSSDSSSSSSEDGEEARRRRRKEKKRKREKVERRKKHKKEKKKKKHKKHKKHGKGRKHKRQRSGAEAVGPSETGPCVSTASGGDAGEPERAEWPPEVSLFSTVS